MKIANKLIKGKFLERPNRFITLISINDQTVKSHLPDPGRLKELLIPGETVYVQPVPEESKRKTRYSTLLVENNGHLISLNTMLPNRFIRTHFSMIPMFKNWSILRKEVPIGHHRLDFLLEDSEGNEVFTEIKSVTFVSNKVAKFPDAVTDRGKKHANLLAKLSMEGKKTLILFVCQRSDAEEFKPMWARDPAFGNALKMAHQSGVDVRCITTNISLKEMIYSKEIPVNLNHSHED